MQTSVSPLFLLLIITGSLFAQAPVLQGHPEDYAKADIEYGARLYTQQCNPCHGAEGTSIPGVDFKSGVFKRATTDRQLSNVISNGFPTAGMPGFKLEPAAMTGVIAYLRNINRQDLGSLRAGEPGRGKALFEDKGKCLDCHRVNNAGSRRATDLSNIGVTRGAGTIERTLLAPSDQLWPINRPVHVVTKEGKVIDGRRLNEDTYTVQMTDGEGRLYSLTKSELRTFEVSTKAAMPSYEGKFTSDELADVVAYLLSLKGQ